MTGYIKEPHTTTFISPTGCGKTHLDLTEKEYNKYFTTFSSSTQPFDGIRHIPRTGSKAIIRFDL